MDFSVIQKISKSSIKLCFFRFAISVFIALFVLLPVNIPALLSFDFSVKQAQAAIAQTINYQGKLMNSSGVAVADGSYNMEFKLYTVATSGAAIWTETLENANKVQVINGLFSVLLGSSTSLSGINFNQQLYLGVNIGGTSTPTYDGEMSPRKTLSSVPSAFTAQNLNGYTDAQFFKTDFVNSTSSTSAFFQVMQSGAGKIAE